MANPLHLDNPMQAWETAWVNARESFTRPLTERDYYEATKHPRYYKRSTDFQRMGYPYLRRHIKQNRQAGRLSRAQWQMMLLPVAGLAAVASYVCAGVPGAIAMSLEYGVIKRKTRSELGTREDVIGRALNRLSRVHLCFAGSYQFYDSVNSQPISRRDLTMIARRTDVIPRILRAQLKSQPQRIRDSKYISQSLDYLWTRMDQFVLKRVPEAA